MGGGYLQEQTSQDTSQIRPSDSNIKTEPNLTTQIKTEGDTIEGNVYHPQTDIGSTQASSQQEGLVISDIRQMNRKPILRQIEPFIPTPGQTTYQIIKQPSDESSQIQYKVLPLDSDRLDVSRKSQPLTTPESPVDSPEMSTVDGVLSQVIEQLSGDNQEKMEAFLKKKNEILEAAEENSPTHEAYDDTDSQSLGNDSMDPPQAPSAEKRLRDPTAKTIEFSDLTDIERVAWERGLVWEATNRLRQRAKKFAESGKKPSASTTESENDTASQSTGNDEISGEQTISEDQGMDSTSIRKKRGKQTFVDAAKLKELVNRFLTVTIPIYRKMPEYGFDGTPSRWTNEEIAKKRLEIINSAKKNRQNKMQEKMAAETALYKEFMKQSAELKKQKLQNPATKTVSAKKDSSSLHPVDDTNSQSLETYVDKSLSDDTSMDSQSRPQTYLEKVAYKHAYGIAYRKRKARVRNGEEIPTDDKLLIPEDYVEIYLRDVMPRYENDPGFNRHQSGRLLSREELAQKIWERKAKQKRESRNKIYHAQKRDPIASEEIKQRNRENQNKRRERKRAATTEKQPGKRKKKAALTQTTVSDASASNSDETPQEDQADINSVADGTDDLPYDDGPTTSKSPNQKTIETTPNAAEMERIKSQFEEYRQSLLEPLPIKSEPIDVKSGEYQNDALNDIFASHPDWQ